jgi:hypothetical protein
MPRRNRKGRFVKSHRAHRRRKAHHARRRRNPRGGRRASSLGYTVGTKKIRRKKLNTRRHYRRSHNPRLSIAGIGGQLMPAALGAVGGLGLDVTMGYVVPMSWYPVALATGYGLHATRIGAALGLGWVARKFLGTRGTAVAHGALIIATYGLLKYVTVQFAPTLPGLSGPFDSEVTIDTGNLVAGGGAGAYLRQLGYLPSGETGKGTGGRVGAYLRGVDEPLMQPEY